MPLTMGLSRDSSLDYFGLVISDPFISHCFLIGQPFRLTRAGLGALKNVRIGAKKVRSVISQSLFN